ncbi:MAG TPA: hypothetical protein ENF26_03910 [Methanomicrobia archaeon]|nr:hypothetical protein [Methanomicrobia archaeon]HEX59277.1 hypothetical protein [Methanomicrobia archaeon]
MTERSRVEAILTSLLFDDDVAVFEQEVAVSTSNGRERLLVTIPPPAAKKLRLENGSVVSVVLQKDDEVAFMDGKHVVKRSRWNSYYIWLDAHAVERLALRRGDIVRVWLRPFSFSL